MSDGVQSNENQELNSPFEARILTTRAELEDLRCTWSCLLAQSDADTIFLTPEWILTWLDEVRPSAEILCITIYCGEELVGIAPFYVCSVTLFGMIKRRCLRVIGDSESSSEYLDLILLPALSDACLRNIAKALTLQSHRWELVWVPYVAPWKGAEHRFRTLFAYMNLECAAREISYYSMVLADGEDGYWSALSSRQRNNIRRYDKRLRREGQLEYVDLASIRSSGELFRVVEELHAARWNSQGKAGAFQRRPAFARFTRAFIKLASKKGWVRVYALLVDGNPIAVRFGYSYGGVLYEIQAGFLPQYKGSGLLCTSEAIRKAIREDLSEYDFLAHGGEYKSRFGALERIGTRMFAARKSSPVRLVLRAGFWPTGRFMELNESADEIEDEASIAVLIVVSNLEFGGAQRQIIELVNNADQEHYRFHVCSLSDHIPLVEQLNSNVPLDVLEKKARFDFSVIFKLARLIRRYRFDIVHSYLFDAEIAVRLAARICGRQVKVVGSERNADYSLKRVQRVALSLTNGMVDLIIANSAAGAAFNAGVTGLSSDRYRVVYNGVDTSRFCPADQRAARKDMGIPQSVCMIGMFASFKVQKNHLQLLDVLLGILPDFPDLRLLLVGEELHGGMHGSDAYRSAVLRKISETDLRDITTLVGNRKDVENVYPACDLTVLPSRHEGLPNVLLESMSCGVPVIATRIADNEQIVSDGVTGLLVDVGDQMQLKEAIVDLLSRPSHRKELGDNARRWILEKFSSKRLAENSTAVYEELMKSGRGMSGNGERG